MALEPGSGIVNNPDGKGGFGDNPQNRNPGGWNPDTSIPYQYNKLIRMTDEELKEFEKKENKTGAEKIALVRYKAALKDDKLGLANAKEIVDRTDGRPAQSVDLTSKGKGIGTPPVTLVKFVGDSVEADKKE